MSDDVNDIGLIEEIAEAEKYNKRHRIIKWAIISIILLSLIVGAVSLAINQHPSQNANSSIQESTYETPQTSESETATEVPIIKSSSSEPSSSASGDTTTQTTSTLSQAQIDAEYKLKMDEENKQLRRQWVGDALKLSAELSNINYLIGLGDATSLTKSRSIHKNVAGEAIGLGILAGLPDSTESQLKKDASKLAIKAQNECDIAMYAAESINEGFTADLNTSLNSARDLSDQFAQKIQDVKSYQGW